MGYTKSNFDSESLQGKEITWKVPAKKRSVSNKREEVHLTILVDSDGESFEQVLKKIRTEVHKHNHCPDKVAKVSYDIIHAESPENRRRRMMRKRFKQD